MLIGLLLIRNVRKEHYERCSRAWLCIFEHDTLHLYTRTCAREQTRNQKLIQKSLFLNQSLTMGKATYGCFFLHVCVPLYHVGTRNRPPSTANFEHARVARINCRTTQPYRRETNRRGKRDRRGKRASVRSGRQVTNCDR